jgi:hypothetical protein
VTALNKVRAEKTLSLNLKVRQDQRTQLDADRLARENQRRLAEGQAPVKSVEELDSGDSAGGDAGDGVARIKRAPDSSAPASAEPAPKPVTTPPDLVLGEATQVMADILMGDTPDQHLPAPSPAQQTVNR